MDKKPLALIIEDHEDQMLVFTTALEKAGYDTEAIRDGLKAKTRLTETVPDMIILDLHLPHINGRELLADIKRMPKFVNTRIILATADAALADSLQSQADLVLLKPISFSQLHLMAKRFIEHIQK